MNENMILRNIQALMSDSILLNQDTLSDLDAMLKIYPYFQTGRILHLKNLQQVNDSRFSGELFKTALCVMDRSKLLHYIEGMPLKPEKKMMTTDMDIIDTKGRTLALIDAFLSEEGTTMSPDTSPKDTQEKEYLIERNQIPLPQKMLISYDYLSFLVDSHHKTNPVTEEGEMLSEVRLQHQDLIDNFILENEEGTKIQVRIPEGDDIKKDPVLQKEKDEKDEFFSETLAKIYIKQKRYAKALDIIRKLYLKFPEKNIYFADQIRFLEILIANSKTT